MQGFRHRLLLGATGQGKSTLAKQLAARLAQQRQQVIVFNPMGDEGWPAQAVQVYNVTHLQALLNNTANYGAHVFIDEAIIYRRMLNQSKHKLLMSLGSIGRHMAYTLWILAQYPTSVDTNIRWNCGECYCFRLVEVEHSEDVAKQYNSQKIDGVPVGKVIRNLNVGQCVKLTMGSAELVQVPFKG